jgi:hypothetical protein
MLFDGHASYISSDVIRLCLAYKVILLCLPPYTTHLLQPLNIRLFRPLASYYKTLIRAKCKFGYNYSVNKLNFLEGYLKARDQAFIVKNITSAWRKAGLYHLAPELIINKMTLLEMPTEERPTTPETLFVTAPSTLFLGTPSPPQKLPPKTPTNVIDIRRLLEEYRTSQLISHEDLKAVFLKVAKAAKKAIAEALTYKDHNNRL